MSFVDVRYDWSPTKFRNDARYKRAKTGSLVPDFQPSTLRALAEDDDFRQLADQEALSEPSLSPAQGLSTFQAVLK